MTATPRHPALTPHRLHRLGAVEPQASQPTVEVEQRCADVDLEIEPIDRVVPFEPQMKPTVPAGAATGSLGADRLMGHPLELADRCPTTTTPTATIGSGQLTARGATARGELPRHRTKLWTRPDRFRRHEQLLPRAAGSQDHPTPTISLDFEDRPEQSTTPNESRESTDRVEARRERIPGCHTRGTTEVLR